MQPRQRVSVLAVIAVVAMTAAVVYGLQSGGDRTSPPVDAAPLAQGLTPNAPQTRRPARPGKAGDSESGQGVLSDVGEWTRFLDACRRRDFLEAASLVEAVRLLPLDMRLQVLPLAAGLDLSDSDAAGLSKIVHDVLHPAADDAEIARIMAAIIAQFERHWPAPERLEGARLQRYAANVQGKPISVPERSGCLPADSLLANVYLSSAAFLPAADRGLNYSAIRPLFERAANEPWQRRPYLEPALSELLGLLKERQDAGLAQFAAEFKAGAGFTERLRWELRLHSMAGTAIADLIALLDGLTDHNDILAALHSAVKGGLVSQDILSTLVPYLATRFDRLVAVNMLMTCLITHTRNMSDQERADFAAGAAAEFCRADPGSRMADAYLAVFTAADTGRSMALRASGVEERHRLVSSVQQAALRAAILQHWRSVGQGLQAADLPKVPASATCLALIEACTTLGEAVDAIEEFVATAATRRQRSNLRGHWGDVLARCRQFHAAEMAQLRELRARLVAVTEGLLSEPPDPHDHVPTGGAQARARACNGLRLADELLAICAIEPVIPLSLAAAHSLREAVAEFERLAFVEEGDRRVMMRSLQRTYEPPYRRVVQGMDDERYVPKAN